MLDGWMSLELHIPWIKPRRPNVWEKEHHFAYVEYGNAGDGGGIEDHVSNSTPYLRWNVLNG